MSKILNNFVLLLLKIKQKDMPPKHKEPQLIVNMIPNTHGI